MGFPQRPLLLEIECDLQYGLDFLTTEIEIPDEVAASQIRLHAVGLLPAASCALLRGFAIPSLPRQAKEAPFA